MFGVKLILAIVASGVPSVAAAHGERVEFGDWGGYERGTAVCQRTVLAATLRCARSAWSVRRRCLAVEFAGGACDRVATNAQVVVLRRRALDLIDDACSERQLGEIGFLGQFDLQADVIAGCRDWDLLMRSAIYEPRAVGEAGCIAAADRALSRSTVRVILAWQRVMRRLAARPFPAEHKWALVDRERERQQRMAARADAVVAAACGEASPLRERAARVIDMALCPLAQVCVQDGVLCPEPICGNGIIEPGELCDDGDAVGDDRCRAGCGNGPAARAYSHHDP